MFKVYLITHLMLLYIKYTFCQSLKIWKNSQTHIRNKVIGYKIIYNIYGIYIFF